MALFSFGSNSGKTTTNQNSNTTSSAQRDPWDETLPYLRDFLKQTDSIQTGVTRDQQGAFDALKANALKGNPNEGNINALAGDLFATEDRSGMVGEAYGALQDQLGGYARGDFLDPFSNPQMAAMLEQVGNDAQSRINQQFAASGRDLSGLNQRRVGEGVTAAQLPLLLDQFNKQQANQMSAANSLYGAGSSTATTQSALDTQRANMRAMGIDVGQAGMDADNYTGNAILNLEQQRKGIPAEDLGMLASLLFPAAQLGGQESGKSATDATGKSKTKSSGFSFGL